MLAVRADMIFTCTVSRDFGSRTGHTRTNVLGDVTSHHITRAPIEALADEVEHFDNAEVSVEIVVQLENCVPASRGQHNASEGTKALWPNAQQPVLREEKRLRRLFEESVDGVVVIVEGASDSEVVDVLRCCRVCELSFAHVCT